MKIGAKMATQQLILQQQYRLVLVDTWWYQVSMEWYLLVLGGTGGQWKAALVDI